MLDTFVRYSRNTESEIWYGRGFALRQKDGKLRIHSTGMPFVFMHQLSAEREASRDDVLELVEITCHAVTPRISSKGETNPEHKTPDQQGQT